MNINGRNLELVEQALHFKLRDVQNQIHCCPDSELYFSVLIELERQEDELKKLHQKIEKALEK